jgi:hypothetical protein
LRHPGHECNLGFAGDPIAWEKKSAGTAGCEM